MSKILRTEPAVFINLASAVVSFLVAAGLLSQANGDTATQMLAVVIPAVLTIISGWLTRGQVFSQATHNAEVAEAFEAGADTGPDAAR